MVFYTRRRHLANAQSKYASTQEGNTKQMKVTILGDHKDKKLKISQNNKSYKDRYRDDIAQTCEKIRIFEMKPLSKWLKNIYEDIET